MGDAATTKHLIRRLRQHYIADSADPHARKGGMFAHEVGINGRWGGRGNHRCDALYAGFTSASGRTLVGHEVKVSRSDWRSELKHAGKAEFWADACHAWYIVAPTPGIVPVEELPEGWGLMVPPAAHAKRFKILKAAKVKEEHDPPWEAVRSFMARLDTMEHEDALEKVKAAVQQERETHRSLIERLQTTENLSATDRRKLEAVAKIEELLGVDLVHYDHRIDEAIASPGAIAQTLAWARATDRLPQHLRPLEYARRSAAELLNALDTVKSELEGAIESARDEAPRASGA